MADWLDAFLRLPAGTSKGMFDGKPWLATVKHSDDSKRHWLYAEEAGGPDFVSANIFVPEGGKALLKPCEMPAQKVIAFLSGFETD